MTDENPAGRRSSQLTHEETRKFIDWLEAMENEARTRYKEPTTRSENPRKTDLNLGKLRAYRKARRELLKRLHDGGSFEP